MQWPSAFGADHLAFFLALGTLSGHELFLDRSMTAIRYCVHDVAAVFARVLLGFRGYHELCENIIPSIQADYDDTHDQKVCAEMAPSAPVIIDLQWI